MEVTTMLRPWDVDFQAALINNYGASGSNASLVVTQAPFKPLAVKSIEPQLLVTKYPFWLCGFDEKSLKMYAAKLLQFIRNTREKGMTLANISFALSRQSNRALDQALIFHCSSINELEEKLTRFLTEEKGAAVTLRPSSPRPVILCFGGQISKFIGLDREVFEGINILRTHLDRCNKICQSLLGESIYPEIFERTPIRNTAKLQLMLFALQYSCAKSWIDCGLQVAAVVGHSFGELTAMCISGTLSLEDTIKMIAGRARITMDNWGSEKGSMVAIEADLEAVERLISESSKLDPTGVAATIACFNGPRSFTLAGSAKAIELVMKTAADDHHAFLSPIKMKKLDVTNSFHSTLVEPIIPDLENLGADLHLVFREPTIPLERAVENETLASLDSRFVATHMRNPVYFNQAVQRLLQRYPSSIWLEAGSNSTVTIMAGRALGTPSSCYFQPINITSNGSFQYLTEATTNLWREGLRNSFWAHHTSQTTDYSVLLLPPYQFEKAKHWMELKKQQKALGEVPVQNSLEPPQGLSTFVGYQDTAKRRVRFRVNTMTEKYQKYVSAHVIAQSTPICPSTFQLVIAMDALMSIHPKTPTLYPELRGMDSHAPMCIDESKAVWLDAERDAEDSLAWNWKMTSAKIDGGASNATLHVSGRIVLRRVDEASYQNDFAKYERLMGRQRCLDLLNNHDVDGIIQGSRNIYKAFSEIVEYKDNIYKGLQKIVGKGNESAGRITKRHQGETWLDLGLADTFCQVAGIFLNSMVDKSDSEMYISDRIDGWIRSPKASIDSQPENWDVFACHHSPSDRENISDVFVFDAVHGQLLEVILGIHYVRVSRIGLGKTLARLAGVPTTTPSAAPSAAADIPLGRGIPDVSTELTPPLSPQLSNGEKASEKKPSRPDIFPSVRELICNLSGLEPEEVHSDSDLADLGIDSLMGIELAREVETTFKCTLETSDLLELTDFQSLVKCIQGALGFSDDLVNGDEVHQVNVSEIPPVNGVSSHVNGINGHVNGINHHTNGDSETNGLIPAAVILEAFAKTSQATDHFIEDNRFADYVDHVLPKTTELCVIHIADAFDELGCSLRKSSPGQVLNRIKYLSKHEQFVKFIYDLLEKAQLVQLNGSRIIRTAVPVPAKSASETLQDLLRYSPDHSYDHKLTYLAGCKLAECLTGKADGLQLIFGSEEGREIATGMYGKSPINVAWIKQIEHFLKEFFLTFPLSSGPIKILEMGAGTGGTTARIVPLLAELNVPFEYTVTDLSSSLVAGARKRFKQYPFMKFKTLDIESPPSADMLHSQHIVLATNCVHATHSLVKSTKNIHNLLRPDGFVVMLEMIQQLPWIDLIFGLLEGWWLFDDGRRHALAPTSVWQSTMKSVGYGQVDWTRGNRPESEIQSIIIGLASGPSHDEVATPPLLKSLPVPAADLASRQVVIDTFVQKYTRDFTAPIFSSQVNGTGKKDATENQCVLVTGATGSLGSYLIAHLVALPSVRQIICLNRKNTIECTTRQRQALELKGIFLDSTALSKLKVYETDTAKPLLGLTNVEYIKLVNSVTHIIHNAWPMSLTRPVNAFEAQFRTMNNLIGLARDSRSRQHPRWPKIGFQLISSIATVGYYPLSTSDARVPEKRMTIDSVMPNGYGDAKFVCERMLDETLHKYPDDFRAMVVRIGQIAGSKTSGYWNPVEHLAFLIKSSQTLKVLPDFEGDLSWCPVNDVAATLGELLISQTTPYPIYHIENPSRQPWREMIKVLAEALDIPRSNIVPFEQFVERVRQYPGSTDVDNPAGKIVEFFDTHFVRMSCGGLILDTAKSREHSATLRDLGPVSKDLVMKYICAWQETGFLSV